MCESASAFEFFLEKNKKKRKKEKKAHVVYYTKYCILSHEFYATGQITYAFGWALPLPCLLHYQVFLPAPAWELFPIANQCDNTRDRVNVENSWEYNVEYCQSHVTLLWI